MALASDLEEFVRPEEEEEELPDPVERCRTRLRKRRRKVTASLRRALEEDERGRAERQEAHEERLKRLMTERWQRRKREEALLQRAARRAGEPNAWQSAVDADGARVLAEPGDSSSSAQETTS
ncbi:unnamed protein product [Durusdinium trenchii]|uniref:Uncharacterized protein n=1 Tax=Durusdinium trenchii TaxID=1381693 RepID=A0ABP0LMS7_9DINO